MRSLTFLFATLLVGCAEVPTLEQLEHEAFLTGDWSKVERREAILARRAARSGPTCGTGFVAVCESFGGSERCACVTRDSMADVFWSWR